MSQVIDGTTVFTVAAHSAFNVLVAFNGHVPAGGDNLGPVVASAFPTRINQLVHTSTTAQMPVSRDPDGLTSRTLYLLTVTNHNAFHVSFVLSYFCDG